MEKGVDAVAVDFENTAPAEDKESAQELARLSTRETVPTAKWKEYSLSLKKDALHKAKRVWRRQLNKVQLQLVNEGDIGVLQSESRTLGDHMNSLTSAEEDLESALVSEDEKILLYRDYETLARENNETLREISKRIRDLELDDFERKSSTSSDRRSRKSGNSSSAIRQKRLTLEEEVIGLRAKMALAEEKQEMERSSRRILEEIEKKRMDIQREEERVKEEIKQEQENFKLKEELVHSEAKIDACAKLEREEVLSLFGDGMEDPMQRFLRSQEELTLSAVAEPSAYDAKNIGASVLLNPTARPDIPPETAPPPNELHPGDGASPSRKEGTEVKNPDSPVQSQLIDLARLLADRNRLPLPEPDVFSGNLLRYPIWIKAFETLIESRAMKPQERLHYLGRYVDGEAKEVVDGFMFLDSEDAYQKAKEMLAKRFGDPFAVAAAYRKKLEAWPNLPPSDSTGLRKYADFLVQCEKAMEKTGSLGVLNDDQENRKMVAKLPKWLIDRWGRTVYQWKEEKGKFPPFSKFVKFLVRESDIACDPVISSQALRDEENKKPKEMDKTFKHRFDRRRAYGASTFATSSWRGHNESDRDKDSNGTARSCYLCKKPHDLDACSEFLKKTIQERKEFARIKGLCFACLAQGHRSKECNHRDTCKTCGRSHPTSLHGDSRKPYCSSTTHCIKTHKDQSSAMIVPVWIHHDDNPQNAKLVYAILDDQSDTTFVRESVIQQLGVSGPETHLSISTMHAENAAVASKRIKGLIVRDFNRKVIIELPRTFSSENIPARRDQIPRPETARQWPHMERIAKHLMPYRDDMEIGLLIGSDCPRAIIPREVIPGNYNNPYAQRTDLGWGIIGKVVQYPNDRAEEENSVSVTHRVTAREVLDPVGAQRKTCHFLFKTKVKEVINPFQIKQMFELDFSERNTDGRALSQDDKKFLTKMEQGIHQEPDGHYQMPLPFRESAPNLPNNRTLALHRLSKLKARLKNDEIYRRDYTAFMNNVITKGYAEKVPSNELMEGDGNVWYIPHHGVYHPKKPGKIRIVFDCSAEYRGESLNKHLLQGPDLTNTLTGVLCRFRQEPIAFMCDLEAMFHQFKVDKEHRNFLRFYWWEEGDINKEPTEYRMAVHLFGAGSSPGCANYGLKRTADDYEKDFGSEAANFIRRDFYVDDGLKSVPTISEAVTLIQKTKGMCAKSGLRLHKFTSNSKKVIESIPLEDRAKGLKDLDLCQDVLPMERALGVQWCVETDTFQFRIILQDRPLTRRGILSSVSSVYDPLGFAAPLLMIGKQILQQLCRDKTDWDDPVPDSVRPQWDKWRTDLLLLEKLRIPRCYKPNGMGNPKLVELHHFSDASNIGYGQCSYLRIVDNSNQVHCSFVMGKARVTPLKPVTIPRLELTAALVSTKVSASLQRELEFHEVSEVFWTDSQVVLGYIRNDARRFHVFVANRVQQIRDHSSPEQWRYVKTKDNPADEASRGLSAEQLVRHARWLTGPAFLWETEIAPAVEEVGQGQLSPEDPEIKKAWTFSTQTKTPDIKIPTILERLEYFSDWHRAKRAFAICSRFRKRLQNRTVKKTPRETKRCSPQPLSVEELRQAEHAIIKLAQEEAFAREIHLLDSLGVRCDATDRKLARKRNQSMKQTSSLYRIDPFVDQHGILRVGGRIKHANIPYDVKHPIILPGRSHIAKLVVRHYHEKVRHQGRGITLNELRSCGIWIIGGSSAVANYISNCVTCRKLRGITQEQKMADLPQDRLEPAPPFTYCAVDLFGPWHIREGRKSVKRYGVLFTCMASRAIHLETTISLETDSFINALRRFLDRRGPVRQIRSDRGTNFIGAKRELEKAVKEMDDAYIRGFLLTRNCDWFEFRMNVPSASHMGGIWERQIRTVRSVLAGLLNQVGEQLDDESLRTLMCEAEAIVNSRPLTVDNIATPDAPEPLTPNHLLTMKSQVILPPPGVFQRADLYLRKRWRRVQHLANEFWIRWRKEFLLTLQERQKWTRPRRSLQADDIVIIKDDNLHRNQWKIARVEETYPDSDGHVRKVKLAVADASLTTKGQRVGPTVFLDRPIQKLVLLVPRESLEDRGFPDEEPAT